MVYGLRSAQKKLNNNQNNNEINNRIDPSSLLPSPRETRRTRKPKSTIKKSVPKPSRITFQDEATSTSGLKRISNEDGNIEENNSNNEENTINNNSNESDNDQRNNEYNDRNNRHFHNNNESESVNSNNFKPCDMLYDESKNGKLRVRNKSSGNNNLSRDDFERARKKSDINKRKLFYKECIVNYNTDDTNSDNDTTSRQDLTPSPRGVIPAFARNDEERDNNRVTSIFQKNPYDNEINNCINVLNSSKIFQKDTSLFKTLSYLPLRMGWKNVLVTIFLIYIIFSFHFEMITIINNIKPKQDKDSSPSGKSHNGEISEKITSNLVCSNVNMSKKIEDVQHAIDYLNNKVMTNKNKNQEFDEFISLITGKLEVMDQRHYSAFEKEKENEEKFKKMNQEIIHVKESLVKVESIHVSNITKTSQNVDIPQDNIIEVTKETIKHEAKELKGILTDNYNNLIQKNYASKSAGATIVYDKSEFLNFKSTFDVMYYFFSTINNFLAFHQIILNPLTTNPSLFYNNLTFKEWLFSINSPEDVIKENDSACWKFNDQVVTLTIKFRKSIVVDYIKVYFKYDPKNHKKDIKIDHDEKEKTDFLPNPITIHLWGVTVDPFQYQLEKHLLGDFVYNYNSNQNIQTFNVSTFNNKKCNDKSFEGIMLELKISKEYQFTKLCHFQVYGR